MSVPPDMASHSTSPASLIKKNSRLRLTPCDRPIPRDASVPAERRYSPPRYAASRPHRLQLPLDPVAGASTSASKFHAPARWLKRPPSPPRPGKAPEEGVSLAEHRLGTGAAGSSQLRHHPRPPVVGTGRSPLCSTLHGRRVRNACCKHTFLVFQMF